MQQIELWNRSTFLLINAGASTPLWLIKTATVIANDLIYLVPLLLAGLWLTGVDSRRNVAVQACVVAFVALGFNQLIGLFWQHPRPFVLGLGQSWLFHAADSSFPSDHVTVLASVGITFVFAGEAAWGLLTLVLGCSVAWARIYLGVHFPLDMLGAVAVAVFTYGLLAPVWSRLGGTVTHYLQRLYRYILLRPIERGWVRR